MRRSNGLMHAQVRALSDQLMRMSESLELSVGVDTKTTPEGTPLDGGF